MTSVEDDRDQAVAAHSRENVHTQEIEQVQDGAFFVPQNGYLTRTLLSWMRSANVEMPGGKPERIGSQRFGRDRLHPTVHRELELSAPTVLDRDAQGPTVEVVLYGYCR